MIEIKEAKTRRNSTTSWNFQIQGLPVLCSCLVDRETKDLRPETNPAYEYCEAKILLAYKDGRLAGRMCAIINHAYNEKWHKSAFALTADVIDDIEVTKGTYQLCKGVGQAKRPYGDHRPYRLLRYGQGGHAG